MIGVLDLRSLGYYKIKQGMLQQNLSEHYHFESAETVCDQFNRFVNLLKKEDSKENYLWLDKNDERKYMTEKFWINTLTWIIPVGQGKERKR